jgi:malate synthase
VRWAIGGILRTLNERRQHLRAERTQRQHRLRVRHFAEVHVEQEQLDADVLESGSGGDGSTVRQPSGKWVPLRVENGAKLTTL